MDYYEEIAAQAKALMDAGDFDAAFALLDVELKMPYIPKQQEEVLVAYYNRCRMERNAQKPIRRASLDQLEDLLNGSLDEQFQAVELLRGANVRMHMEVLRDALCREKLHYLVRAYLVEILISQQLHEEITMVHEGLEVTLHSGFCGSADGKRWRTHGNRAAKRVAGKRRSKFSGDVCRSVYQRGLLTAPVQYRGNGSV